MKTNNLLILDLAIQAGMSPDDFHKEVFHLLAHMRINRCDDIRIEMKCPDAKNNILIEVKLIPGGNK